MVASFVTLRSLSPTASSSSTFSTPSTSATITFGLARSHSLHSTRSAMAPSSRSSPRGCLLALTPPPHSTTSRARPHARIPPLVLLGAHHRTRISLRCPAPHALLPRLARVRSLVVVAIVGKGVAVGVEMVEGTLPSPLSTTCEPTTSPCGTTNP